MNIPRKITIEPVLNGYLCHVGCQIVVFGTRQSLIHHLEEYLDTPDAVEARFRKEAVHRSLLDCPTPVDPRPALTREQMGQLSIGSETCDCERTPPQAYGQQPGQIPTPAPGG